MDFELRPLTDADIPALQQVYNALPEAFRLLIGRPAPPDQAARDFRQATATPGRYQFGILIQGRMSGVVDCKLDDDVEGQAYIGMLLLTPPYNDPAVAGLVLRILGRWLAAAFGVRRLETGAVAHDPVGIAFWRSQGFEFTGEQYRRDLPDYHPRFLILAKDIAADE